MGNIESHIMVIQEWNMIFTLNAHNLGQQNNFILTQLLDEYTYIDGFSGFSLYVNLNEKKKICCWFDCYFVN